MGRARRPLAPRVIGRFGGEIRFSRTPAACVGRAARRWWQALESLELELDSVDASRRCRSRRFTHAGASRQCLARPPKACARHATLPRVTGQGDDELRARLRAIRVFEGDLPSFDVGRAPEDPVELLLSWLVSAIDAGRGNLTLAPASSDARRHRPWTASHRTPVTCPPLRGSRPPLAESSQHVPEVRSLDTPPPSLGSGPVSAAAQAVGPGDPEVGEGT
jgi:hypothetical protein